MTALSRPASKAPENDFRRSVRQRAFLAGRIVFHDGAYSYECVVRDMSEGGARIEIPAARMLPRRFYFLTSKEEVAYDAELVWRTRLMAGIKFRESVRLATCKDPKLRYLKQIAIELCPDIRR
jgi:hypothetical protein